MAAEVKSETIDVNGNSVVLVSVKNGDGVIGTCSAGLVDREGNSGNCTRLFYMGLDPVINMVCPNFGRKNSDKLVSLCQGYQGSDAKLRELIDACFNRLNGGDLPVSALRDIFGLLQDGVYTVYLSDYYPTDGNGAFFWGGYNILHEVRGTAEQSNAIGANKTFKPCFLFPTEPLDLYKSKTMLQTDELVRRRKIQGIVYHVSGFHSALLKGHYGAVCCSAKGIPFRCAVIERITDTYTEPVYVEKTVQKPAEGDGEPQTEKIVQTEYREGISGFRSPSVKIPTEAFPRDMLNILVSGRPEYKPEHFGVILAKLGVVRRKMLSNNILPLSVLEKAEKMPDFSMVESAFAVSSLSDEELNCLLAGDVEHNGEVIISPNFYSSIVTACNFLQFTDTARFVDFAIAIMDNPELSATHDYVSRRVLTLETDKKLYSFFKKAEASGEAKYSKILQPAKTFILRYDAAAKAEAASKADG